MNNLELIIACVLIISISVWLSPDPDAPRILITTASTPHKPYVCEMLDPDLIVWDAGADPLREIVWVFTILVVGIFWKLSKEQKAITPPHNPDAGDVYMAAMELTETYCSEEEGFCGLFPFYTWY